MREYAIFIKGFNTHQKIAAARYEFVGQHVEFLDIDGRVQGTFLLSEIAGIMLVEAGR